jgi:hypothetical protein
MPLISAQFHPIPPDSTICPPFPPLFEFPPHSAARLLFNTASPCGVSLHGCYTPPPALRDSPAHQSRCASHIPRKPHTPKIFCGTLRRGCYLLDSVVAYCGMVAARLPPPPRTRVSSAGLQPAARPITALAAPRPDFVVAFRGTIAVRITPRHSCRRLFPGHAWPGSLGHACHRPYPGHDRPGWQRDRCGIPWHARTPALPPLQAAQAAFVAAGFQARLQAPDLPAPAPCRDPSPAARMEER